MTAQKAGAPRREPPYQTATSQKRPGYAHSSTKSSGATTADRSDLYFAVRTFVRGFTATAVVIVLVWAAWSLAWVLS